MKLALAGVNHRTAPVEVREQLAFRTDEIAGVLDALHARGAAEALVLCTCNRVEIAATLEETADARSLVNALLACRAVAGDHVREHVYVYEQREAIRHLFRVAASLDSMIVGEPQILGQLKQAYVHARNHGSLGAMLDVVLTRAFHVAKRIRTETEIGQNAVSVSFAAVELAREIFGELSRKRVLIIGAGKMSEATARHLLRDRVSQIWITNRTPERAAELAAMFRGETIPYGSIPERLSEVDIVITSSAAPSYILGPEIVRRAIEQRRSEPMFLIDIAVPRNIDPRVNDIEHAFLYDIDDLMGIASRNLKARSAVAEQAEGIVDEEVGKLESRFRERNIAPTIQSLQAELESIRQDVVARYRGRLGALTIEQEEALEAMTRGIINKVAHGPISEMRRHAAALPDIEAKDGELVSVVRRMFRLRDR